MYRNSCDLKERPAILLLVSEADAIAATTDPATTTSISDDLRALGVEAGMTVMAHSSLSKLGFVVGGPQAVVTALMDVLGETGTLMMPTHSGALSDPVNWEDPPVPAAWWPTLRSQMPAFDPGLTPTRSMGAIVDCFRGLPGVQRSNHPTVSAAAVGPNASALVEAHELNDRFGETSPQGRLYALDGHVLLLGVDHGNNTSLHLSEARSGLPELVTDGAPVVIDGQRQWVEVTHLDDDADDFAAIGDAFAAAGMERRGKVGVGVARLCRSRDVVDFGVNWMRANRTD